MRGILVAAALFTAAAGAGLAWMLAAGDDDDPPAAIGPWKGIWPQDSRDEAQQAQRAADEGDPRHAWQLDPDGDAVFVRYAREVLGWSDPQPLVIHIPEGRDWVRESLVIRCPPGPHPDYPKIDCGLPARRTYAAVNLTVERLVRRDADGIWIVTESEATSFHQPAPPSDDEARTLVTQFAEARVRGSGAQAYLSEDGRLEYGQKQQLGPLYGGCDRYDIAFIDGPSWPLGGYEVGIRLFFASTGASDEETLFVRARSGFSRDTGRLLVLGGRTGLSGP
ncbi:MAG TPA: hypothetical protein VHL78_02935 [Actinomycetota bacterium]|nr:hypothetical protein [Actinomycetota bacterium]